MDRLAQLIEETRDVRELKRAVSVKLGEAGMPTEAVRAVLQVTPRVGRKWHRRYEREGVNGLAVRNRGSKSYLRIEQRREIEEWLGAQENADLPEADGKVTCMRFALNAPEQNPTEDVWRKGKTHLRKQICPKYNLCPSQMLLLHLPERTPVYFNEAQLVLADGTNHLGNL
jgi:hypothetical protein